MGITGGKIFTGILAGATFTIALLAVLMGHYRQANASDDVDSQTVTVQKKDFAQVLRLTGATEAEHSRSILAPMLEGAQLETMVVTRLTPAGTHVKKGDILVQFDTQAQNKDYLDKKAAYESLVDQLIQKHAAEDAARAKDETELKEAENALKKAQLEATKNEIVSRIDAEKNQEALQEAQATLKQLQETFKLKREAAAVDIRMLEIQRDQASVTMKYAQSNAQKMTIVSPMDGVLVPITTWLGGRMGEVQEGAQVRPGASFMKIADTSEIDVRATVNEEDLPQLSVGQQAKISLEAYPNLSFSATLIEISPLGHISMFSNKVRTFSALFTIQGTDPKLMEGLSAAADIEIRNVKNVLVIPRQSIHDENGQNYVWLKDHTGFEKQSVKVGPKNDLEVVVESGLSAGDVIRKSAVAVNSQS